MLKNWTNTQKALAVAGIVLAVLIIWNWDSVWAWVKSLGGAEERMEASDPVMDEPVVPQQVVQNIIVAPRPVQATCAQIKAQIDHFTNLLAQYPTSVQLKNRLDQLKSQYAQNCTGGPKPNPNAAA